MTARSTMAAALVLALAGCGGGDKAPPAKEKTAPAEEGAPIPANHTPESCMLKAGLESIEKGAKASWTAFHPDGYAVRVKRYSSPAAANHAVDVAPGLAQQANFYGVFGPAEDEENGATVAVARCLRAF